MKENIKKELLLYINIDSKCIGIGVTTEIEESRKVLLLGITIDNLLIFSEHIENLDNVVRQIINYMHYEE